MLLRRCMSGVFIWSVRFYQKYLSAFSVGACRYYPSCSQYTLWLLYFDNPFLALFKSFLRILRCHQCFMGGIAYPRAKICFQNIIFAPKKVKYWFVPTTNASFLDIIPIFHKIYYLQVYIVKSFPQRQCYVSSK